MRFLLIAVFLAETWVAHSARRNQRDQASKLHRIQARHGNRPSSEGAHDVSGNESFLRLQSSTDSSVSSTETPSQAPMYALLMLSGILIGCLMLCCVSQVTHSVREEETTASPKDPEAVQPSLVKKVVRFTRATIASLGEQLPQITNDDTEDESDQELQTNKHRLIVMDNLYVLNEDLANHFVESTLSPVFPVQAADGVSQLSAWHACSWALLEDEDGLHLGVRFAGKEMKHQLMGWKNNSASQLEVKLLPQVSIDKPAKKRQTAFTADGIEVELEQEDSEEEKWTVKGSFKVRKHQDNSVHVQVRDRISIQEIPGIVKKDPKTLSAFLIKWNENFVTVLGSDNEDVCAKWVKILNMYSNIGQRFYSAFMWKLNSDVAADLKGDFEEDKEALADIRNWRRRLCLLEYLHTQRALCITYMSEKEDDGRIGNVIVSAEQGEMASVKTVPTVSVSPLASWEEERVRVNVHQYNIALAGDGSSGSVSETTVPKNLYAFEVRQQSCEHGGQEHSMYAFDDEAARDDWLAVVDTASKVSTPSQMAGDKD